NTGYLNYLSHNFADDPLLCPGGCKQPISKSYFRASLNSRGIKEIFTDDKIKNMLETKQRNKLAKNPNFQFCLTPDCLGGRVIDPKEQNWYQCPYCNKESFLQGNDLKAVS